MIGFLIRKNFYDLWDNMFRIILLNLGFIVSLAIPIFLPKYIPSTAFSIVMFAAGLFWCCIYLSASALSVKAVSDYGSFGFADFWANLKAGWKPGVIMGILALVIVPIIPGTPNVPAAQEAAEAIQEGSVSLIPLIQYIIMFYLNMSSIVGLLLAAVIFWTFLIAFISLQFFFAIRARLDTKPIKIIKKCFIIFFDNPAFAVFVLLHTIVTLVLSTLFAFLIPGPAGILLFFDEALRLRLMKYDWLEANPETEPGKKRRQIPWDAILIDEREKTGTRSFKSFIFPWKD